ncbi:amidase family protein [Streptomyces sp. NPDC058284]|uniref:amidase family protein n=1 Tax=unclassified Streptomyces TaxID=2593676 RepID=UPI003663F570
MSRSVSYVVSTRLRTAGGVLLAGTNLPEFSYCAETADPRVSRTRDPWDSATDSGGVSQELVPLQAAARLDHLDRLARVPRGNGAGNGVDGEDGTVLPTMTGTASHASRGAAACPLRRGPGGRRPGTCVSAGSRSRSGRERARTPWHRVAGAGG